MFVHTVIITSNGASTNIDPLPDVSISYIGQMIRLATFTKRGVFNFNKITNVCPIR